MHKILVTSNPVHLIHSIRHEQESEQRIVKTLNNAFPGDDLIAQLKNEFLVTRELEIPGLRKSIQFFENEGKYSLELAYVNGVNLKEFVLQKKTDLKTILQTISQLCTCLSEIHHAGWVHGSITSSNIIIDTNSFEPTLIDASLMTRFSLKASAQISPEKLQRILPYISPEQTGRTSRALDYRSDFYSLGVTLYEILVGAKPFEGDDSLDLIYAHLAKTPVEPSKMKDSIPTSLSDVVMKLLAKNAEDRYQSALGLRHDIERIIEDLKNNTSSEFKLGEKDFSGQLQVSQKLFGREKALATILEELELSHQGDSRAVIILGDSGTGKSAIVQEVRKPITGHKGYFLNGKFDQLARNIPYSAWIEIFKDLVNQMLASDEQEINKFRSVLVKTLGNSIGVLTDLIPNLNYIIHSIPKVDELEVNETQSRLNDILNRFFKAVSTAEHPLTLFIDDLHWADNASLNLLKTLLTDAECKYLFVIGAMRSDELQAGDPLLMKLGEIKQAGIPLAEIKLDDLAFNDINALISETLSLEPAATLELSEVIYTKTQGNPYYTYQFIYSLYDDDLLKFNWDKSLANKTPTWEWDLTKIQSRIISSNVVEFMVAKIVELQPSVIDTLKTAACIGNSFKLKTLCTVRNETSEIVRTSLDIAIEEGYVFYKNVNHIHHVKEGMDVEYQFAHDRVQQAFYSLIPESEKRSTHFNIGKLLFESLSPEQRDEQIFQLVFHLNAGKDQVVDTTEKSWMAQLNFDAGKEAKKIIAFDSAYEYFSISSALSGENIWNEKEDFAFEMGKEILDCTFLTNRLEEAEKYFDFLLTKIPDNIRKAELYYLKMAQYERLGRIESIFDTGIAGLALLGLKFSKKSSKATVIVQLLKTHMLVRKKSEEELKNLPEMTDPSTRVAMFIIYKFLTFAFDRNEELFALLGFKLLELTIKKGNHDYSAGGYTVYGGLQFVVFKNVNGLVKFHNIGAESAKKSGNKKSISSVYFGKGMTHYLVHPYEELLEAFGTSLEMAMEVGQYTDAAPSTMYFYTMNLVQGKRLSEIQKSVQEKASLTRQMKADNWYWVLASSLQLISELRNGEAETVNVNGEKISSADLEQKIQSIEQRVIRIHIRIFQMYNHLLFERYNEAIACEKEILEGINVTIGTSHGECFQYWRALLYCQLYNRSDSKEKGRIKKLVKKITKRIAGNAKLMPANFQHWDHLIQAEFARINGDHLSAQSWYNKAIETARTGNYVQDVAYGNFLCGRFNQEVGNTKIADFYFMEAISSAKAWGAENLADHFAQKLISKSTASGIISSPAQGTVDQESLIKLSSLISGEIDFEKLIKKLMSVFIENAGAEKAILVMRSNEKWVIAAEQQKNKEVKIPKNTLLGENETTDSMLSVRICQYVMRTSETVILDDAALDDRFSNTTYIKQQKPRSILCMPLIKSGELTGLVYLENNLMAGAFKADRIRLLNHISSQIAVSVDNAKLYSDLRVLNNAYERFVPKEFLEILGKNSIVDVNLGDQTQMNMTVLFADIRGFTRMSETMTPAENFKFINDYLGRMAPIIRKYHGFVDKYVGDEIMALFPTSPDDAFLCGIAMLNELKVYAELLKQNNLEPIEIGIGLHTGSLMLGTVGGENRMNSTVISDTVNLASRVEGDTKISGAPFMITREIYDGMKNPSGYAIRKLGNKMYRGRSASTEVFEVFEGDELSVLKLKKETQVDFEKAVTHFEQNEFKEALSLFDTIIKKNPLDKPAAIFLDSTINQLYLNLQPNQKK